VAGRRGSRVVVSYVVSRGLANTLSGCIDSSFSLRLCVKL
jgi:hypothetical protein